MRLDTPRQSVVDGLIRAYRYATYSPDPSTQCGASVYTADWEWIADGWNDFTKGVESSPEKLERPLKYQYFGHAEINAILAACLAGKPPVLMVAPWAACTECARAIAQSGIQMLIRHKQAMDRSPARWIESIEFADGLLTAAGVEIIQFDGRLQAETIRHCGELWTP